MCYEVWDFGFDLRPDYVVKIFFKVQNNEKESQLSFTTILLQDNILTQKKILDIGTFFMTIKLILTAEQDGKVRAIEGDHKIILYRSKTPNYAGFEKILFYP